MDKSAFINAVKGGLIVSCQALRSEPLYTDEGGIMPLMAKAAMQAGACGIRANSVRDILQIRREVPLPIIGIIKIDYPGCSAYITPTMKEVDELVAAGTDVIATDCTRNTRPGGYSAAQFIRMIHEKYPGQLLMADCADLNDALAADQAGIDFIGTTLAGYVPGSVVMEGPNYELAKAILAQCRAPLLAEGKIHTPQEARKMLDLGATAVVVGGAITRPKEITERFVREIRERKEA